MVGMVRSIGLFKLRLLAKSIRSAKYCNDLYSIGNYTVGVWKNDLYGTDYYPVMYHHPNKYFSHFTISNKDWTSKWIYDDNVTNSVTCRLTNTDIIILTQLLILVKSSSKASSKSSKSTRW